MSVKNLKCTERKFIEDDHDTVMTERCWKEMHRGNSRKWLIQDASQQKMNSSLCSTMKSCYQYPLHERTERVVGARRYLLKKRLYEEVKNEILIEESQQLPIEEYCTEYDVNFNADGFQPSEDTYKIDTELVRKYPLYSSPSAVSYWNHYYNITKNLQGITKVSDCKYSFRKNYSFSKPLSEVLDK